MNTHSAFAGENIPASAQKRRGLVVDLRPLQRPSRSLRSIERRMLALLHDLRVRHPSGWSLIGYFAPSRPALGARVVAIFDSLQTNPFTDFASGTLIGFQGSPPLAALARSTGEVRLQWAVVADPRCVLPSVRPETVQPDLVLAPKNLVGGARPGMAGSFPGARMVEFSSSDAWISAPGVMDPIETLCLTQIARGAAPFVVLAPELGDRAVFALAASREEVLRTTGKSVRLFSLRPCNLPARVPNRITGMARSCVQFADIIELPTLSEAAAVYLMRTAAAVVLDASAPLPEYAPEDVVAFGGRPFLFDPALARSEPAGMRDPSNPLVAELMRIAAPEKATGEATAAATSTLFELPLSVDELIGASVASRTQAKGGRRRFALVAPFASRHDHGVLVYNRETGRALSAVADVDLVTIKSVETFDRRSVRNVLRPEQLMDAFAYDEIVHVLYNHEDALPALRNLRRVGGAVILHDAQVLDLLHCDLGTSGLKEYIAGILAREPTEEEFTKWVYNKRDLPVTFLDFLKGLSTNVIVHSKAARQYLERTLGVRATYLPVAIQHPISEDAFSPEARLAAKRRCGLFPDRLSLGTFGAVQSVKGDTQYPYIVRELIERGVDVEFYYVGRLDQGRFDEINRAATKMNVRDRIHFAEDISENAYMDHLVAMDVGVQLRSIGGGQVSGALLDCVAGCLPTVASAPLADSIDAPEFFVRRIDEVSSPLLIAYEIAEFIPRARAMPRPNSDWRNYVHDRTFAIYAKRLQSALVS